MSSTTSVLSARIDAPRPRRAPSPLMASRSFRLGAALLIMGSMSPQVVLPMWAADTPPVAVQEARAERGMVVSDSRPASLVGRDVLARGGNAVDAAVATAFALAVTWPEAGNIGGGGFMLVHPVDGREAICIDYREVAPAAAMATMFDRDSSRQTHAMVGVPGTVRGLARAHAKYGTLPWKELVLPAVNLARDGFEIDRFLADSLNDVLVDVNAQGDEFAELRRVYGKPSGEPWTVGERLVQPDLASTLDAIAEHGPDAFYTGRIAEQLVAEMQRGHGLITAADLSNYIAQARPPIRGTFRDWEILGPPPPSSGGICLIEALQILEPFDLRSQDRFSARNLHLITEALRRAFCDRARYLGDPDFVAIPPHLTSKSHAASVARTIDVGRATPSEDLAPDIPLVGESSHTTHFSVIDRDGMAVSNTYTLEESWGSWVVVRGAGFVLNNEMGDFNWLPGVTDREGRIGTPANQIAPGKRMLSSQTPVIVLRDGKPVLVTGSPGGRTIISTVLCIVLNVLEFDQDLAAAIDAPRMHHAWWPDELTFESDAPRYQDALAELRAFGHRVTVGQPQGSAHSIQVVPRQMRYVGVADRRRGGFAAGD